MAFITATLNQPINYCLFVTFNHIMALFLFSAFAPSDNTDGVRFLLTGGDGEMSRELRYCRMSSCALGVEPRLSRLLSRLVRSPYVIDLRNFGAQWPKSVLTDVARGMDCGWLEDWIEFKDRWDEPLELLELYKRNRNYNIWLMLLS